MSHICVLDVATIFKCMAFLTLAHDVLLKDIMQFISGSPSVPPLGLPSNGKILILFKHGCSNSCSCKPNVSTCSLSMTIPVHYDSLESMREALVDAVKMSLGFDL